MLELLRQCKTLRSLLAATAGFVVYGSWGFFVNYAHGLTVALKAGITQGSYSFTLTLIMSLIMEGLFQLSERPKVKFSLTFFIPCLLIYSTAWSIHTLAGTPEILLTILPGATISTLYTLYTLFYTLTLFRLQNI